ncbi:hypothetical protein Rsub_03286 [Raphidocelis subcapitata]|uniref:Uncharacterized protein n=1 Tax=Raphidocelis subcapitata TaxID=307507 RepID=A0A2V0NX60_9CHLO|nr:hypothetical protein Rsub_03286 [Raphidocelis subcapitata]|eukprot:GBF90153.1 hypothetical protein Rsub_03286 [Raphidocelis subcapitata]
MLAVSTSRLSGPRRAAQPRSAAAPGPRRAAGLRVAALFGFGGGAAAGGKSEKELEKEEQFRIQQPEKKPIIWASQWEKMQAAKKGGKK